METVLIVLIVLAGGGVLDCIYVCCPPIQPYVNMCCNALKNCCESIIKPIGECCCFICNGLSKALDKCCKACFGVDVGRFPDEVVEQNVNIEDVVIQQNNLDPLMHHPDMVIVMGDNANDLVIEHA